MKAITIRDIDEDEFNRIQKINQERQIDQVSGNEESIIQTINNYKKKEKYIPVKNSSIEIKTKTNRYKIIRLRDEQYIELRRNSILIQQQYPHFMCMIRSEQLIYSSLSKMYTTLKDLFGESGKGYDDWKCSFSFPFLIKFQDKNSEFDYLMNVIDIKGGIEILFFKIVHEDDEKYQRKDMIYEPSEEFAQDEMIYFMNYFAGYLSGYHEMLQHKYNEPFFKTISGSGIVYGYKDGHFFDKIFETGEDFGIFIDTLRSSNCLDNSV